LASNHPELLRSKGVVVNVRGKGVRRGRQVSVEKMSESKPTDDASSRIQGTVKTGAAQPSGMNREGTCLLARWQSVFRRHELNAGFGAERENLAPDAKGNDKWQTP
jgi:hypothetical protein